MLVQTQVQNKIPVKEFFISTHEHEGTKRDEARVLLLRDTKDNIVVAWSDNDAIVSILVSDSRRSIEIILDLGMFEDLILWVLNTYAVMNVKRLNRIEEELGEKYKDLERREKELEEPRTVWNEYEVEDELKQYAATLESIMKLEKRRDRVDELVETILNLTDIIKKLR